MYLKSKDNLDEYRYKTRNLHLLYIYMLSLDKICFTTEQLFIVSSVFCYYIKKRCGQYSEMLCFLKKTIIYYVVGSLHLYIYHCIWMSGPKWFFLVWNELYSFRKNTISNVSIIWIILSTFCIHMCTEYILLNSDTFRLTDLLIEPVKFT